ncbi:hypothetical protein GCM10017608_29370 [Agromyces luteolus]|nr:hypothetical protein GCM10017608_29370 [Agromyces luteolus]
MSPSTGVPIELDLRHHVDAAECQSHPSDRLEARVRERVRVREDVRESGSADRGLAEFVESDLPPPQRGVDDGDGVLQRPALGDLGQGPLERDDHRPHPRSERRLGSPRPVHDEFAMPGAQRAPRVAEDSRCVVRGAQVEFRHLEIPQPMDRRR